MESVNQSLHSNSRHASPLLTIAEAAQKTGRSHSTIRRLIRTIADHIPHPDRSGVEPSPKAVEAFKKRGENFTWKIREEILLKHLPPAPPKEEKSSEYDSSSPHADVFKILRRELDLKNQQIEKQWEVIGALNERLREGNILMGSLQQRLALPAGDLPAGRQDSPSPTTVDASSMEAIQRASKKKVLEAKEGLSKKASMKPAKDSAKKGVFSWIFR